MRDIYYYANKYPRLPIISLYEAGLIHEAQFICANELSEKEIKAIVDNRKIEIRITTLYQLQLLIDTNTVYSIRCKENENKPIEKGWRVILTQENFDQFVELYFQWLD